MKRPTIFPIGVVEGTAKATSISETFSTGDLHSCLIRPMRQLGKSFKETER